MKKMIFTLFSLFFGVTILFGCSAKHSSGGKTQHTHSYISNIIAATCTEKGYTLHKCSCGDSYYDNEIPPLGHNWVEGDRNYYCSKCNRSEVEGFTFKLATWNGEACYAITNANAKAVVNEVLEVPRKYESLPVRGILNCSFAEVTRKVKKIIIHDNIKNIYNDLWHKVSIYGSDWDTSSTLEEIVFDSTCKDMRIESCAFRNCPNLYNVNVEKGMIKYAPRGIMGPDYIFEGTPYFKDNVKNKNGLYYIADLLLYADIREISGNIIIDSDTVWIDTGAFAECTSIKSIFIPKTVCTIGKNAFYRCSQLETITFEGTIEEFRKITIGSDAFSSTKAKFITCTNGKITQYSYNGYTYNVGEIR